LTDIDVFPSRAEDFPSHARVVTLRAVERFDSILPVAARLVVPSGRLALLIGQSQVGHARDLLPALRWLTPIPVPLSSSRVLLIADTQPTV
jgi:16S rRNA G527 N7-methylase RsmG